MARFDSIRFSRELYDQLADKDIQLAVNIYSGRRSSRDNLLDFDPAFDKISNVVNKQIIIKGKLIYGDE